MKGKTDEEVNIFTDSFPIYCRNQFQNAIIVGKNECPRIGYRWQDCHFHVLCKCPSLHERISSHVKLLFINSWTMWNAVGQRHSRGLVSRSNPSKAELRFGTIWNVTAKAIPILFTVLVLSSWATNGVSYNQLILNCYLFYMNDV